MFSPTGVWGQRWPLSVVQKGEGVVFFSWGAGDQVVTGRVRVYTEAPVVSAPGLLAGGGGYVDNLMLNPQPAKQTSIMASFLLGKYDLLSKNLIYGQIFRSAL